MSAECTQRTISYREVDLTCCPKLVPNFFPPSICHPYTASRKLSFRKTIHPYSVGTPQTASTIHPYSVGTPVLRWDPLLRWDSTFINNPPRTSTPSTSTIHPPARPKSTRMALFPFLSACSLLLSCISSPVSAYNVVRPGVESAAADHLASPAPSVQVDAPGEDLLKVEPFEHQRYKASVVLARVTLSEDPQIDACLDPRDLTVKACKGNDCNKECPSSGFTLHYSLPKDGGPRSDLHNCTFVYEPTSPKEQQQYLTIDFHSILPDGGQFLTKSTDGVAYPWYFEQADSEGKMPLICAKASDGSKNCMANGFKTKNGVTKGAVVNSQVSSDGGAQWAVKRPDGMAYEIPDYWTCV